MLFIPNDESFDPQAAGFTNFDASRYYLSKGGHLYRPGQAARMANIAPGLLHPTLAKWLQNKYGDHGIYHNQKLMIEAAIAGKNVISTTPTASGKSLGFMVPAFHKILTDPKARVVVFYPLKALGQDQIGKWLAMAAELGLPPDAVQRIDGSVLTGERAEKFDKARIALTTPDMFHSWFMANINTDAADNFLAGLQLRILDELHEYDGIFGTNMMFLLRRMDHLQSRMVGYKPETHRQYIGASGTLPDARRNFKQLTGVDAVHIGIDDNGAPLYRQNVFHAHYLSSSLASFLAECVDIVNQQAIIFVDSRVKVEEFTHLIRDKLKGKLTGNIERAVIPYKSGLRPADYEFLHGLINSHDARVVVSTSALEAGIDVDFTFGVNVGLPMTKSALLQRMGRVGRRAESSFVIASGWGDQLTEGYSLQRYLDEFPMETPTLYPNNTGLQLAAALCLRNEMNKVSEHHKGARKPHGISWPRGFGESYERAGHPWDTFAPHERPLIPKQRLASLPQLHLPIRSLPSERFTLVQKFGLNQRPIGEVAAEAALREYTPGAIIRHMGQRYRVNSWKQGEGRSEIILSLYTGPNRTTPILRQSISTALVKGRIIDEQFKTPLYANPVDHGFLAYMSMRVNLSVTAFIEYAKNEDGRYSFVRPYRYYDDHELAKTQEFSAANDVDYGPKRHVSYETFGVVIHIPERWFGKYAREELGERIVRAYCEKNKISPGDIGYTHMNSAVFWGENEKLDGNMLIIYERGGNQIGLLDRLPSQLRQILLSISTEIKDGPEREERKRYSLNLVDRMARFTTGLLQSPLENLAKLIEEDREPTPDLPEGYIPVLEPFSMAKFLRTKTVQETVKILRPAINDHDGKPGYWVQSVNRQKFYSNNARWVTIKRAEIGVMADGKPESDSQPRPDVPMVNRFVSAAHIVTEVKHPRLAMQLSTGRLFRIHVDPDTKELDLTAYTISDETTRSLPKHPSFTTESEALPPAAAPS